MHCPKVAIFDVDDTLAESFQPPSLEMLQKIRLLMTRMPFAIISAAGFQRIERDFLTQLTDSPDISRLYVLPNSSAQAYTWRDGWNEEYSLALTPDERETIARALTEGDEHADPRAVVIDREVQVAYAAIGLKASLEEKQSWDPDQSKRMKMRAMLEKKLPDFEILIGGSTTIDITRKAVNKAYGVRWLSEKLRIAPADMLYVGDALYPGGNDAVVIPTGVQTRSVTGPADTEKIIDEVIAACAASQ
jgi:phosphomannomutase